MMRYGLVLTGILLAGCAGVGQGDGYLPGNEGQKELRLESAEARGMRLDRFEGYWLGSCVANWTGLVTEMDRIGQIGEIQTEPFYTRADWGGPDGPNIWDGGRISRVSPVIDFVLIGPDSVWGADDDTDIEFMYQFLIGEAGHGQLTAEEIRAGWLRHIEREEENFLWVSNQRAFDLMGEGYLPPETGRLPLNGEFEMIDAQLTTEIFGLYAPGRPERALELAYLPIRTVADAEAADIAEFYVTMYSLAAGAADSAWESDSSVDAVDGVRPEMILGMADRAREDLEEGDYPAAMYDRVRAMHAGGLSWEAARDSIYQLYQVRQADGYEMTGRGMYCNGCFAAGINFAASLVSLFWGGGDFQETLKIGVLCGWDSDNPTATWGGMLGYMLGADGIEAVFGRPLSRRYDIHRTRRNFPQGGLFDFRELAEQGLRIQQEILSEQ